MPATRCSPASTAAESPVAPPPCFLLPGLPPGLCWPSLAAASTSDLRSPSSRYAVCVRLHHYNHLSVRSLLARRHASVSLARTCHPKSTRPGAELRGHRQALTLSLSLSHSLSSPWPPSSSPMPSSHGPFQRSPDAYAVPAYDAMYAAAILYACVVRR
jgi:hypothetical protein